MSGSSCGVFGTDSRKFDRAVPGRGTTIVSDLLRVLRSVVIQLSISACVVDASSTSSLRMLQLPTGYLT